MSAVGPYLDTVPALNAILQYQQGILSALQNLQVYVTGITLTTIDTGYVGVNIVNSAIQVPVQIQSSLINVTITGVVGVNTGVIANAGAYTVLDQVFTPTQPSTRLHHQAQPTPQR